MPVYSVQSVGEGLFQCAVRAFGCAFLGKSAHTSELAEGAAALAAIESQRTIPHPPTKKEREAGLHE
jgi:hypothetical protein